MNQRHTPKPRICSKCETSIVSTAKEIKDHAAKCGGKS